MRNQILTGYLLHNKPYQESRALYYFFSESHGVVHGVGKKGMPLFKKIQLFASGKRSLKNFTQIQAAIDSDDSNVLKNIATKNKYHDAHVSLAKPELLPKETQLNPKKNCISGQNLYAGFYLNEILWKLLGNEDAMLSVWQAYEVSVDNLHQELTNIELRILLRHFEAILFAELGCSLHLSTDFLGSSINPHQQYQFIVDEGFHIYDSENKSAEQHHTVSHSRHMSLNSLYNGKDILSIDRYKRTTVALETSHLQCWSRLHKTIIEHLLEHKILQSRELWKQYQRYTV